MKTETHYKELWQNGVRISNTPVVIDVTQEWVTNDLRAKGLAALTANQTYLAIASPSTAQNTAQVKRLTRECSAIIRLLLGGGLKHLQENSALLDDTATDT